MEGMILLILSLLKSYSTDAAFTYTPLETGFCESTDANLTWVFDNAGAQSTVVWTVNDTITVARLLGGSSFLVGTGYSGKLQNDGNGGLIIKGVNLTDSGKYKCAVSYNDGTPQATNEQTVTIYSTLNTQVDILEEKKGSEEAKLTSSLVDPSITYTWNSAYSTNFPAESYITVKKNGEYRLCISGGKAKCLSQTLSNCANHTVSGLEGSATTVSTFNLSTDVSTTTNSQTSSELSTDSLSYSQSSVSLFQSTVEGSTFSSKTETSTSSVTLTSPSGLSEEMIIIISTMSAVGGIILIVIFTIVLICYKRRSATKSGNKLGKLHIKNDKNNYQNLNYEQLPKMKRHANSGRNVQGGTDSYQNHPQYDILYGGRMPTGVKYPRSQSHHQQNYLPTIQHHYRYQNSEYYPPYTDPRNVMYYQIYPESRYSEDISGYSRAGPYRMQHFYPQSYPRQDKYTDDELERKIGHKRGDYGGYWDNDNDTLY